MTHRFWVSRAWPRGQGRCNKGREGATTRTRLIGAQGEAPGGKEFASSTDGQPSISISGPIVSKVGSVAARSCEEKITLLPKVLVMPGCRNSSRAQRRPAGLSSTRLPPTFARCRSSRLVLAETFYFLSVVTPICFPWLERAFLPVDTELRSALDGVLSKVVCLCAARVSSRYFTARGSEPGR